MSFYIHDLTKLQQALESEPENEEAEKNFNEAVEYTQSIYENLMSEIFWIVMYSKGAFSTQDIDKMCIGERKYFYNQLRELQTEREKQATKGGN